MATVAVSFSVFPPPDVALLGVRPNISTPSVHLTIVELGGWVEGKQSKGTARTGNILHVKETWKSRDGKKHRLQKQDAIVI